MARRRWVWFCLFLAMATGMFIAAGLQTSRPRWYHRPARPHNDLGFMILGFVCLTEAVRRGMKLANAAPPTGSGACPSCNYDLSGLPPGAPCPECAAPAEQ